MTYWLGGIMVEPIWVAVRVDPAPYILPDASIESTLTPPGVTHTGVPSGLILAMKSHIGGVIWRSCMAPAAVPVTMTLPSSLGTRALTLPPTSPSAHSTQSR